MTTERMPIIAEQSLFTFYDIESLANVFSLVAYTPFPDGAGTVEVFYLVDDADDGTNLADDIDHQALGRWLFAANPGLPAFPATAVTFFDLRAEASNVRLAEIVGLSDADRVNDRAESSSYPASLRPLCDTDAEYDPAAHPFLAGYNSTNYDTTMLALYLNEVFQATEGDVFRPTTAAEMRTHNDQLFSADNIEYMPRYLGWDSTAASIRQAMLHSGRHIDIARLNELQWKVPLKGLLGLLGRQIKESDRLSHDTTLTELDDLYELLAYNVSDCLGLAQLFEEPTYSSTFDLKAGLLAEYPETVYEKDYRTGKPAIDPSRVRRNRLTIDSTSAKFVGLILSPYGKLEDIPTVSFKYPATSVAEEQGIEQVDVLDQCQRFFEDEVAPDRATNPDQAEAHRQFMDVVAYYRSIEGENFNDSDEYRRVHGDREAKVLKEIPRLPNNLPYFDAAGRPTSCFATFSTGGIHGAEADMKAYAADKLAYAEAENMLLRAQSTFPDPLDFRAAAKRQHELLTLPDGSRVTKSLVISGKKWRKSKKGDDVQNEQLALAQEQVTDPEELLATQRPKAEELNVVLPTGEVLLGKAVLAKHTISGATYRQVPATRQPGLFVENKKKPGDRSTRLDAKYARTSVGHVIHEDFSSYYPNLLRNMRAFWNPDLGEDRYAKIFFDKEHYGKQMKAPGIGPEEKTRLNTLRNGTKLILNSASGAGDTTFGNSPIRMNNTIISMRIIGQLFSWRIGQAQTLAGARIISTNTDGLYSVVDTSGAPGAFDAEANNRVLAEQQAAIGIEIEPEPMFLISKDSNNRLELVPPDEDKAAADDRVDHAPVDPVAGWEIDAAGGGTLACHAGPTPAKKLAHPAVTDFTLARYLQTVAARGERALSEPFDPELGRKILQEAIDLDNPVKTLMLCQNIITASRGSITYPFAVDPLDRDDEPALDQDLVLANPQALQMVNRVFVVEHGTPGARSLLSARARVVNADSKDRRRELGEAPVRREKEALAILRAHGWAADRLELGSADGLALIPEDRDVVAQRISGIDPSWSMVVRNDDLYTLDAQVLDDLIASLDLEVYLGMLDAMFSKNWKNFA